MSELINDLRMSLEELGIEPPSEECLKRNVFNFALTEFLEKLVAIDVIDFDKLGEHHSAQFEGGYVEGEGYQWTLTVKECPGGNMENN
jgi:hypothetical protein